MKILSNDTNQYILHVANGLSEICAVGKMSKLSPRGSVVFILKIYNSKFLYESFSLGNGTNCR
jgi:hypothetical protein